MKSVMYKTIERLILQDEQMLLLIFEAPNNVKVVTIVCSLWIISYHLDAGLNGNEKASTTLRLLLKEKLFLGIKT